MARVDRILIGADRDARHVWQGNDPAAGTVAGNNTLDTQIADARRGMGEARWAELNAEWEQSA